jgi:hypothetical protein
MACCVVGSLLLVIGAGLVRAVKTRLLRTEVDAPERWRLTAGN